MRSVPYNNDNSASLCFCLFSLIHIFLHFGFWSITPQQLEIFSWYLVRIKNRSTWSVACKNNNSANLLFQLMSPDPYFSTIGLRGIILQLFEIFER